MMTFGHGGHGGGGGHHGGGGHGHGGGGGRGYYRGGGGYWPGYTEIVAVETCPAVYSPVVGADGLKYDNACYARQAGTTPVRRALSGLGLSLPTMPPWLWGLTGVLVGSVATYAATGYLVTRR